MNDPVDGNTGPEDDPGDAVVGVAAPPGPVRRRWLHEVLARAAGRLRAMTNGTRDEPDPPPESVLAGAGPFEWSLQDSVAFEGALDTIGMVIACCTWRITEESRQPRPDAAAIGRWEQAQAEAATAQHALRPTDRDEIDRVRREYGLLYRQPRPTEPAGA
jgi:hypothetical protein